jgi:hypothetical protein
MSNNRFSPEKFYDFTIVDENNFTVGHIRIKPSGIHWAPPNAKKWYGVPLTFAAFMEKSGTRKVK